MDQPALQANPNQGTLDSSVNLDTQVSVQMQQEQVIIETLPLEKKLDIVKKINYLDQFELGRYIDAMDTVNQWCLAEIVGIDQRSLNIHFDGWSSKWDIVAPFRKHSKGYTGQNKIALRKLQFNLEDLHSEKMTVEKLIENNLNGLGAFETTQYIRGKLYIYVDFLLGNSNYNEEALDAVIDFIHSVLRLIVQWIKKLPSLIHLFAQTKINSDLYMIDENIAILYCYNELFDILKKIFVCCHRCARFYFFNDRNVIKYENAVTIDASGQNFEKERAKEEDEFDVEEIKERIMFRKNIIYGQFINFVNYFADIGGFTALLDALKQGSISNQNEGSDEKIPLDLISVMLAPFKNCNTIFSQEFTAQFVTTVKEIVFQRIRNLNEKEIKEIEKDLVGRVLTEIKDFLNLHYTEGETSELIESNQLFMAHRFLKSTYLEKRLKGLQHIKHMIDRIEAQQKLLGIGMGVHHNRFQRGDSNADTEMNGGSNIQIMGQGNSIKIKQPLKWLTAEYLKDWIISQRVLDTVLGESTHLEIVKRSGCILKFLAKNGALPIETIDLIWKCQLGKHEEMVRVIYNIIKDLVPHIQLNYIDYLYSKIQSVPPKLYDEKFISFLKDFTVRALENQYEFKNNEISISEQQPYDYSQLCDQKENQVLQNFKSFINDPNNSVALSNNEKLYGLPIFWDLLQDKMSNSVSNEMLENAINSIIEILKQQNCKHIRMQFVIKCIENLLKGESIVQSIIISQVIISEYPENKYMDGISQLDLLLTLENEVKIVEVIIQNILNYYHIVKDKLKTIDKKKQTEDLSNNVFMGRHSHQVSLNKMLEFLEFLIIQSSLKVSLGIKNIDTLWNIFVQQPNFNQDQTIFLKWINKQRELHYMNRTQELQIFTEEEKQHFFITILCNPTYIDFKKISITQVKCFQKYFKDINRTQNNLIVQRKNIKVANFKSLVGLDALWKISTDCQNEKVKEESIELLVDIHLKFDFETVSYDDQKQIWEEFINKCMAIIEQGDSTQVQNAIQLISKFLDRYDGKKSIKPEMKVSPHFQGIQPLNVKVFNKTDQTTKVLTITYFQTIGFFRQKIAEAFDYQLSEFVMNIKGNYIDPEEDDDRYIKDIGQFNQLMIQKNPQYIPENHPKNIIANNQAYFEKLFSLLNAESSQFVEPAWDLLMKLPVNARLQQELRELTLVTQDFANWSQLLDAKSTYRLLYSLKILNSLSSNKKDPKTQQWRNNFMQLGGHHHLLNTFIELDVKRIENNLTMKCIEHLILLIFDFLNQDKKIINEILNKKEIVFQKCIQLIDMICDFSIKLEQDRGESYEDINKRCIQSKIMKSKYKSYMTGNKIVGDKSKTGGQLNNQQQQNNNNANEEEDDNQNQDQKLLQSLLKDFQDQKNLVTSIFQFINSCILAHDPTSSVLLEQYKNIDELLFKSMLRTENFVLRIEMTKRIKDLLQSRSGKPEFTSSHIKVVEKLLFKIENQTSAYEERVLQFYDGLSNLLELLSEKDLITLGQKVNDLAFQLAKEIHNRDIIEKNQQKTDHYLVGKIKLLKVLLQKFPQLKQPIGESGLLNYLLHSGLFDIANGNQLKSKQMAGSPKCKTLITRTQCVKLVAVLCRDCIPNLKVVLQYLKKFNENPSWRTNKDHDWQISVRESEKSSTGYVGIKNLGCICYMISIFQQLFMIPSLRNDILSIKNNNPDNQEKEENMLYQLQLLWTGLLKSEKQYVNPKGFCHSYKDWDGNATNVLEQMDVDEFYNMFMDRLETAIKGNPQEKTIQYHFGGKYTHEIICKGCPHHYERQEPFLAMSVQVKNKKSLAEALDTFIQGDMLEGDNAYMCEKCDKKVDTLKRTVIKKLPRYLIFPLKRFEYDFDRGIRVKVNDYLEFPMELDMEPYTQEGLARKEKAQKKHEQKEAAGGDEDSQLQQQTDSSSKMSEVEDKRYSDEYYKYNLSGIVVHTGTADSGHYYSFIKDKDDPKNGKWYEMNDSIVRDFDPADIPSETYGGEDTFQGYNMVQMKTMKWRNAYVLMYERQTFDDVVGDEDEEEAKKSQQNQQQQQQDQIMQNLQQEQSEIDIKIAYENQKYWQNRFLFGNEYHELVYDIALNWNTQCLIPKNFLTKNDDFHLYDQVVPPEYLNDVNIHDPIDIPMPLTQKFTQQDIDGFEHEVFKLAAGYYIGIHQRAYSKTFIPNSINLLKAYINKNVTNAQWLIEEFCNEKIIEETLLQSPSKEMRKFITGILYCAMLKVYTIEKDKLNLYWTQSVDNLTVLGNFILILIKNLYDLKRFVKHNPQYFQLLARFSTLGPEAREFLLRAKMVGRLMDYFFDEVSPYKDEFKNMNDIVVQFKEKPEIGLPTQIDKKQMSYFQEISEKRRQKNMAEANPKYKFLIETISNCIRALRVGPSKTPFQIDDFNFQITSSEKDIFIPEAKFLKRIFSHAQKNRSINAICKTYCHYSWFDINNYENLLKTLIAGLNDYDYDEIKPFLMLMQYMVYKPIPSNQDIVDYILTNYNETLKANQVYFKYMEVAIDFLFKLAGRYEKVRLWCYSKKAELQWLSAWAIENKTVPIQGNQSNMRTFKKRNNMNIMMQNQQYKQQDSHKATINYYTRTNRMNQLLEKQQFPDLGNEIDLDVVDLQDNKFMVGEFVDLYRKKVERLENYIIEQVLDEMINIKYALNANDGLSCFNWQACDSDRILPRGAYQQQTKNKFAEMVASQLEQQRKQGGSSGYGDNNMQSDGEDDDSDDSDKRVQ